MLNKYLLTDCVSNEEEGGGGEEEFTSLEVQKIKQSEGDINVGRSNIQKEGEEVSSHKVKITFLTHGKKTKKQKTKNQTKTKNPPKRLYFH